MSMSDLQCFTCGRKGSDPWPEDLELGNPPIGWMTETECILCYKAWRKAIEDRYRAAVETLLGRFTDEQFEALKFVLRTP